MGKHEQVRNVEEGERRRHRIGRWAVRVVVVTVGVVLIAGSGVAFVSRRSSGPPRPPHTTLPTPSNSPSLSPSPSPSPTKPPKPSPSDTQSPSPEPPANPGDDPKATLRIGMHGKAVRALQVKLDDLGYTLTDVDGVFGDDTLHAVLAFQKVEGLSRDGVAGPVTKKKLAHATRPKPRSGGGGLHVEIDIARQVIFFVKDGKVTDVYDVSTGSEQPYITDSGATHIAHTPRGSFEIQRKINAWRESELGLLYRPAYFYGGYAIHGSASVPAYPASHGCVRVTLHVMDQIYDRLAIGTPVSVYG